MNPKPDPVWLAAGLRTPFARVDGDLKHLDAIAISVPVVQAMAKQLAPGTRADFVVWGTVMPSLGMSNIAREAVLDAGLDPATPAFSTVLACSTSMVAAFEAASMLGQRRARSGAGWRQRKHEPCAVRPESEFFRPGCGGCFSRERWASGWIGLRRSDGRMCGCSSPPSPIAPPARAWASTARQWPRIGTSRAKRRTGWRIQATSERCAP